MKILLAIDDGPHSERVVETILSRRWPAAVEFKILVVLEPVGEVREETRLSEFIESYTAALEHRHKAAEHMADRVRKRIHEAVKGAEVHCFVKNGQPAEEILALAHEWGADRIILGAHSRDVCPHNLLGSVSHAVAKNANCTVEIVRPEEQRQLAVAQTKKAHGTKEHSGKDAH